MNTFQSCRNTSDAVALYLPQNLYLKPIARIHISVQLPQKIEAGKSISNWEIMEKLRVLIRPEEFSILKVSKNTLEFIRFDAEIEDKSKLYKVIALLDARSIKINAFNQNIKVRASEAKLEFPNRHAWDSFFRDAKDMDEMKPGERPDTVHISNLPIRWFVPFEHMHKEDIKPSQKMFHRVFEKFGNIRYIDIPICDPYRSKMKEHMTGMKTFTFDQDTFFEGYVQFKDYVGFTRAMDAFRGMKLLYKEGGADAQTVNIKVDFDRTKHLSDSSLRRRQIVRDRLIAKDRDREEKEKQEKLLVNKTEEEKRRRELEEKDEKERRRREREEKRKARHFAQLKLNETDELQKKIAKEERKLIKAQRKLEAIRLLEALFERIKAKRDKDEEDINKNAYNSENELTKYKKSSEKKLKEQRQKLNKALEGHVVLESILGKNDRKYSSSESSSNSNSDSSKKHKKKKHKKKKKKSKYHKEKNEENATLSTLPNPGNPYLDQNWFVPPGDMYQYPPMFGPPMRGYLPPMLRGRGMNRNPGSSRGSYPRRRGAYNPYWNRGWRGRRGSVLPSLPPEMEHQYYKYFSKFLEDHDDRKHRSNSRSSSRSRSLSYKKKSRRNSYNSRSRRQSRSTSRSSSSSRSRRRSRSRSRDKSRSRSKSRTYSRNKSRSKSKTKSRNNKSRSKSKSRSRSRKRSKENSRSPSYRSIDSSKFISPSRLRSRRSRSKSWSLPRRADKKKRSSWSKSPSNSKV